MGCAFRKSWLSSACSPGIIAAQQRPKDQAVRAAWHSTGLGMLGLTLSLVTDCSMYNGLPFRITALTSTEKNGEMPKRAGGFQT